jgi:hypothetical protein
MLKRARFNEAKVPWIWGGYFLFGPLLKTSEMFSLLRILWFLW